MLLRDELSLAVVTNDIFTTEDAEALRRAAVLPTERIVAVETGCCPHTAIRDDIAANLDAVEELEAALGDVDLMLVESGGDNLTAIFSRGLVDAQIFVIDVAGGDDVPRKGGPGVTTADLLVINKTDLAPHVGADLDRMLSDATARRSGPVLPTSLRGARWRGRRRRLGARRGGGLEGAGADVRATARIEVARRDGRDVLVDARSEPPLAVRATADRVLLVGSAAAPVGGDELALDVVVGAGATLSLGTAAATLAWPGATGRPSTQTVDVSVAAGGALLVGARAARGRRRVSSPRRRRPWPSPPAPLPGSSTRSSWAAPASRRGTSR